MKKTLKKIGCIAMTVMLSLSILPTNSDIAHAEQSNSWDFSYTGNAEVFTVPSDGMYLLETWGAQGGGVEGGKGGYSTGEIYLQFGESLYLYVGGKPESFQGGFNGGGNSGPSGFGGGGATDIRLNNNSIYDRILVAGGGGGGSGHKGGAGGGLIGNDAIILYYSQSYGGAGATQTEGGKGGIGYNSSAQPGTSGTLGKGGTGGRSSSSGYGDGGGGGYYGGGGAGGAISGDFSGGGGSGYIGSLNNGETIDGNSVMPSPTGGLQIGQTGNGFIRITGLDIDDKGYEYMVEVIGTFEATTINVSIPAISSFAYNPNTKQMDSQTMTIQNLSNAPISMNLHRIEISENSVWKPTLVLPTKHTKEQWKNLTQNQTELEIALGISALDSEHWLNTINNDTLWNLDFESDNQIGVIKTKSDVLLKPTLMSGSAFPLNKMLIANYILEFSLE